MLSKPNEESNWISVADLMTALMVIFMFIAINYILQVIDHTFVEEEIYNKLEEVFEEEINEEEIELGPDGTIRFKAEPGKNLFASNRSRISAEFQEALDNFIPKYWEVLTSDTAYFKYIKEIRIEGHTDTVPPYGQFEDSYIYNLNLSSRRASSVLDYLRQNAVYQEATVAEKRRMNFLFTSIGFSFSRALNDDKEYVYSSDNKQVNNEFSRRVEFRIVTSNEELINAIKKSNGGEE
jgi:outer membrane protein OmpA-like peptidoglycan-associated protein